MTDQTQQTLTVNDLAGILGVSEDAVLKRIRRGRLQADKDAAGQWAIPWPQDGQTANRTDRTDTSQTDAHRTERNVRANLAVLEERVANLQAQLEAVTRERDNLSSERDYWREQARAETANVARALQSLPPPADSSEQVPWWQRFSLWRKR